MSGDLSVIVITYTLNRGEDPLLFDHLAAFKKGRPRRARLGKLISMGFEHEKFELKARTQAQSAQWTSGTDGNARHDLLDDLISTGVSGQST